MESVNTSEYTYISKKNHNFTVFSSLNPALISVAQNLLKEAGIKYSVKGSGIKESFKSTQPVEIYSGVTKIMVTGDENIMAASKILVDLEELDFHDKECSVL